MNFIVSLLTLFLLISTKIYDFNVKTIDGQNVSLSDYKGKVLLIVNVASECGYTKQYADLENLYKKYKDQGFEVLGFPCNDFGNQEPASESEIKSFCTTKYGVTFDMFSKIEMSHPLYQHLTTKANPSGKVDWNFEKFLINKEGEIIGRFKSNVNPMSEQLKVAVENALQTKKITK